MDGYQRYIEKLVKEHINLIVKIHDVTDEIEELVKEIISTLEKGNKVLIAGNGGSAAGAQHFAAELVGRFKKERKALACIALTTDSSIMTAISNDYSFESVFSRQIEAIGKKDDLFIGISTSGNSRNIYKAIRTSSKMKMRTFSLLGNDGGIIKDISDNSITIHSSCTARIQECHLLIVHIICELVENEISYENE